MVFLNAFQSTSYNDTDTTLDYLISLVVSAFLQLPLQNKKAHKQLSIPCCNCWWNFEFYLSGFLVYRKWRNFQGIVSLAPLG